MSREGKGCDGKSRGEIHLAVISEMKARVLETAELFITERSQMGRLIAS